LKALVEVLVLGGLDPTGGAGLIRDVLTARALGATVLAVGTAWTVQGSTGRVTVEARAAHTLAAAVADALTSDVQAVKVGLVPDEASALAVRDALDAAAFTGPVVVDPVLCSSSGHDLYRGPLAALDVLLCRATLVTPNAHEVARLAGRAEVTDLPAALAAARALCARGVRHVLVKGGHLADATTSTDLLVSQDESRSFSGPRIAGPSPRGTGCALATALAVELARGHAMPDAIAAAKRWLASQIATAEPAFGTWHLP
jgi:hydroxymethylpyrimidine/phosphomethylpyrimidine kinase